VGSNDKGIYEVRLDNMIDYSLFQGNAVIGFENLGKQINTTCSRSSILNHKKEIIKTVTLSDFKRAEQDLNKGNKNIKTRS
jgi:hypothetical protein